MSGPAALDNATLEKFRKITAMTYKEQAVFYLNAFWTQGGDAEAESVWKTMHDFIAVDHAKGKNGNQLDEVLSHHYLQKVGRTLTAIELRHELRKIDLDANGEMALAEYLIFRANQMGTPREVLSLINNPQGGETNPGELAEATARVEALNKAFDDLQVQLEQQKQLEAAAKSAEAEARKNEAAAIESEKAAKTKEAEARAAEEVAKQQDNAARAASELANAAAEVAKAAEARAVAQENSAKNAEAAAVSAEESARDAEAALKAAEDKLRAAEKVVREAEAEAVAIEAALKAEQDAYTGEINRLDAVTKDESAGIVKRNTAVQDLARLKGADPLPLQRAKINQGAQVRKVQRVRQAAEEETAAAAAKTAEAAKTRAAAEEARAKATAATKQAVADREQAVADRAAAEEAAAKAKAAADKAAEDRAKAEDARAQAEEARKQAEAERAQAEAARAKAVEASEAAEAQTKMVEAHIADIKVKMEDAQAALEEIKKRDAIPHGAIWWMEREILEKKRSLPQRFQ